MTARDVCDLVTYVLAVAGAIAVVRFSFAHRPRGRVCGRCMGTGRDPLT